MLNWIKKRKDKKEQLKARDHFKKWVKNNMGVGFVDDALEKYDALRNGETIGGFMETMVVLEMIKQARNGEQE